MAIYTRQPKTFHTKLSSILLNLGISLRKLGKQAGISAQQLSKLNRGDASPSLRTLRRLLRFLLGSGSTSPRDIVELMLLGIGEKDISPSLGMWIDTLPHTSFTRIEQPDPLLSNRCILSDRILENLRQNHLTQTIDQMWKHQTLFFYFLPEGSVEDEALLLAAFKANPDRFDVFRDRSFFINAPKELHFSRILINNVHRDDRTGFYILGSDDWPVYLEIQPTLLHIIADIIKPVISRAIIMRGQGINEGSILSTKGSKLQFVLRNNWRESDIT